MLALLAALLAIGVAGSARGAAREGSAPVPILMYHVVGAPPPGAPHPELFVSPEDFAAQVDWLAHHGYRAVTLAQVFDHWYRGQPLPPRPVVLSFDDGYRGDFLYAVPALRALGWPGVLGLQADFMHVSWGLSPARVRTMIADGWELDSHTLTHPDLTQLDDARLEHEVAGSRALLRSMFHVPVDYFCYPYGSYDGRVVDAVRAAGYRGATTTVSGLARPDEPYTLARVRVGGGEGAAALGAELAALGLPG